MLLLFLLAVLAQADPAPITVRQIRPVRSFGTADTSPVRMSFAYDEQYEYLATPEGLFRSRRFADPAEPAGVIAFPDRPVHQVVCDGGYVYVLVGNGTNVASPNPVLMRSPDHGETFLPLDAALGDCSRGTCQYLVGYHIEVVPGALFAELGGNLLVTPDEGQHWWQLHGTPANGVPDAQVCPLVFTVSGTLVYLGSECPLDEGWISSGRVAANLLSWDQPPRRSTIQLENRNVQFIRKIETGEVFAGVEGGLAKQINSSSDFGFAIHYDLASSRYPYIRELVASSNDRGALLAGGFDKANRTGYLAFTSGTAWSDVSARLPAGVDNVALLAESRDGTLLIVLQDDVQYTIGIIDIGPYLPKRRAVRR